MEWMNSTQRVWLASDYEAREDLKELNAEYSPQKKRWFIPGGVNLLNFRDYWRILDVPFEDKGVVKSMGAKFDPALRSWVVPKHREYGAFAEYWHPEFKKFLFNNRFETLEKMGEGGQSIVFLGHDTSNEEREEVVIKLFPGAASDLNDERTAYDRELTAYLERINGHPGFLKYLDWGKHEASDGLFIVTKKERFTLEELYQLTIEEIASRIIDLFMEETNLEVSDIAHYSKELAEGLYKEIKADGLWDTHREDIMGILDSLCFAFENGILHRDLKPANIFVRWELVFDKADEFEDFNEQYLIGDFGTATFMDKTRKPGTRTVGSYHTEPWTPDPTQEDKKFEATKDCYGWAAVAVGIVTRTNPVSYSGLNTLVNGEFKELVPNGIFKIIKSCLHKDPSKRPQNVIELREMLVDF